MVLSKRERIILLVTVIAVAAILVDWFAISPVMSHLEQLENRKQQLLAEMSQAQNLFERRKLMEKKWKTMLSDGLRNDAEVESEVLRALGRWSQQTGLSLTSVKPERVESENGLREITFTVAGKGSLNSVTKLLWQIETATMPIRIGDLQLGLADERGSSMSLQLRLSALYLGTGVK